MSRDIQQIEGKSRCWSEVMLKPIAIALDAMTPRVRAELMRPVRAYDPRAAEIVPGTTPKWHLIEVHEPAQREVERELIKRRFGIFVPETESTQVVRGRRVVRKLLLFPGYVFLFVWDISRHWSRIVDIRGVSRIVASEPDANGYVLRSRSVDGGAHESTQIPEGLPSAIVVSEGLIDEIRALENGERPIRKRRTRGKRKHDDDVIAVYPWSAFPDRILTLDSEGRNQTLRKALGLS